MNVAKPGEAVTFRQELWFEDYQYGTTTGYFFNGEIYIQRGSDNKYWDGDSFETGLVWLSTNIDVRSIDTLLHLHISE